MDGAPRGQSLQLFFIDGTPDGMQTAEEFNWPGYILLTPRTRIAAALQRPQIEYVGVYFLLGDSEDGGIKFYVGQSKNMAKRIRQHDLKKDWWTTAVFVTTRDNSLNEAHALYLERRLHQIAKAAGQVQLDNEKNPGGASLHEAIANSMDEFLHKLMMFLPAMRIDCLQEKGRPTSSPRRVPIPESEKTPATEATLTSTITPARQDYTSFDTGEPPVFELIKTKQGIQATAVLQGDKLVVQEGARTSSEWPDAVSKNGTYRKLFDELHQKEILRCENGNSVFTRDYAFNSFSAAGSVVNGYQTNGPKEWKLQGSEKTYKEWESEQAKEALNKFFAAPDSNS